MNLILTKSEKENSELMYIKNKGHYSLNGVLHFIKGYKEINEDNSNSKLTTILLENGYVVKLQTYDNGTPYIFVFEENEKYLNYIKNSLEWYCQSNHLLFTEINT